MSDDEYHRELAEYVPNEGRSIRHPLTITVMRVIIVIALIALVVPGVAYTISLQVETAGAACAIVVSATTPDSTPDARLQLWGGNGPGWYCYSRSFDGTEVMLRALGMIPGLSYRPSGTPA